MEYLQHMVRYNQWMNHKLYDAVQGLSDDAIAEDRGAFFTSILGTLNHILVADLIWFGRFLASKACKEHGIVMKSMPRPTALNEILFDDIRALRRQRETMDNMIIDFSQTWHADMLESQIRYRDMAGNKYQRKLADLLQHVFNHQTHHRGQVTTLLFQANIDVGATDLLVMPLEG